MFVFKTLEVTGCRGSPANPWVQIHWSFPWKWLLCMCAVHHKQSPAEPGCAQLPQAQDLLTSFFPSTAPYLRLCTDLPFYLLYLHFHILLGVITIFLLCCASDLVGMALQSVADLCYQLQGAVCVSLLQWLERCKANSFNRSRLSLLCSDYAQCVASGYLCLCV